MLIINRQQTMRVGLGVGAVVLAGVLGVALKLVPQSPNYPALPKAAPGMKWEYTRDGFGGYVQVPIHAKPEAVTPWSVAVKAYASGRFPEAMVQAEKVLEQTEGAKAPELQHRNLQARSMLAYCAAWRKDYSLAKESFASLRQAASELPDHGQEQGRIGEVLPTFEEEGAFQHAVCTGATGDTAGAEAEYDQFVRDYPQSILIHAAIKRIRRFHKGNLPKDAERLWMQAMQLQHAHDLAERREAALCGPQCLAELLRRRGAKPDIHALADEMHTTEEGTSLQSVCDIGRKHGVALVGKSLTQAGLQQQTLPAIALIGQGHFVVVDAAAPDKVTVWDPAPQNPSQKSERTYDAATWSQLWHGVALAR